MADISGWLVLIQNDVFLRIHSSGAVNLHIVLIPWGIKCGIDYMEPVYEQLHRHLLARDIIHADETPCQVLKEEGKTAQSKSYMWLYGSENDGLPPIRLYDYQPDRGDIMQKNS